MDFKVYRKETVLQPEGETEVLVPDVIDLIPKITTDENGQQFLDNVIVIEDTSKDSLEQACALSTIFQKGLDPLDKSDGVRWSQALLEEINPVQLMNDIATAVSKVTTKVAVEFDTVVDAKGKSYLTYSLRAIA